MGDNKTTIALCIKGLNRVGRPWAKIRFTSNLRNRENLAPCVARLIDSGLFPGTMRGHGHLANLRATSVGVQNNKEVIPACRALTFPQSELLNEETL